MCVGVCVGDRAVLVIATSRNYYLLLEQLQLFIKLLAAKPDRKQRLIL